MSRTSPFVSILINNYNYGRFLRDAVDSALRQTYLRKEVIVVDDGSIDDSREIIRSYGSRLIPIFKDNAGQASALNAGFAASSGDLVCFLDSDDVFLPNKLERICDAAQQHPQASLIYHAYRRTDAELRPQGTALPVSFLEGDARDRVLRCGGYWPFPLPAAMAVPRSMLSLCMPIPEVPFRICADSCLAYCLPILGPIVGLQEVLCLYRMHGANVYANRERDKHNSVFFARERMERYQRSVEGANQVLSRLGRKERLRAEDNLGYVLTKYQARGTDRPSWATTSWKLLSMASEPSPFVRLKSLVKFWVRTFAEGTSQGQVG